LAEHAQVTRFADLPLVGASLVDGAIQRALDRGDGAVVLQVAEGARAQVALHDFAHLHAVLRVKCQLVGVRALLLAHLVVLLVLTKKLTADDLIGKAHKVRQDQTRQLIKDMQTRFEFEKVQLTPEDSKSMTCLAK